eukprot:CAMPEP_0180295354 /NCGR_PEP_ID=MMETSP0988-20121125/18908_1 /TAXON_ID=697907 /ORGANISM="non described non described, Strain CCMP2293" /LENGTH=54 /DNA_ID=CAMNT_0022272835 /DNA_START=134 /DNA_END=294 /DNA_ORIENTATION=-
MPSLALELGTIGLGLRLDRAATLPLEHFAGPPAERRESEGPEGHEVEEEPAERR